MEMGYLALLVAEIPKWVSSMIEKSVIDLAHYDHFQLSDTAALVAHYDKNLKAAINALSDISEESINTQFELKNNGQVLWAAPKLESIGSTINHWIHHRGQLTVYMRLNDIAVPSIYGPSADEKGVLGGKTDNFSVSFTEKGSVRSWFLLKNFCYLCGFGVSTSFLLFSSFLLTPSMYLPWLPEDTRRIQGRCTDDDLVFSAPALRINTSPNWSVTASCNKHSCSF